MTRLVHMCNQCVGLSLRAVCICVNACGVFVCVCRLCVCTAVGVCCFLQWENAGVALFMCIIRTSLECICSCANE